MRLPEPVRGQLEAWAESGYPYETCGVLIGRQHGAQVMIERAEFARNANTERARDRYQLDPRDLLLADRAAEHDGLEIVGIWHTHPDHPAQPSQTDRTHAWRGWSYIIVSLSQGRSVDLRSWRLGLNGFEEELIQSWQP